MPTIAETIFVLLAVALIVTVWRGIRYKNPACDDIAEESRNPDPF